MSAEANETVVRRWIDAYNERDRQAEADARAPGYVAHVPGMPGPLDAEAWVGFIDSFVEAFPDLRLTVESIVCSGRDRNLVAPGPRRECRDQDLRDERRRVLSCYGTSYPGEYHTHGADGPFSNLYAPPGTRGLLFGSLGFARNGKRMGVRFLPTGNQQGDEGVVLAAFMRCETPDRSLRPPSVPVSGGWGDGFG